MANIIKGFVRLPLANDELKLQLVLNEQHALMSARPAEHCEGISLTYEAFMALPLCLQGTQFQQAVWRVAQTIPPGETRSYQWVTEQLGRKNAVRAVAQALRANPVLVRMPCHRVIYASGALGGFAYGQALKQALLSWEREVNF